MMMMNENDYESECEGDIYDVDIYEDNDEQFDEDLYNENTNEEEDEYMKEYVNDIIPPLIKKFNFFYNGYDVVNFKKTALEYFNNIVLENINTDENMKYDKYIGRMFRADITIWDNFLARHQNENIFFDAYFVGEYIDFYLQDDEECEEYSRIYGDEIAHKYYKKSLHELIEKFIDENSSNNYVFK